MSGESWVWMLVNFAELSAGTPQSKTLKVTSARPMLPLASLCHYSHYSLYD